MPKGMNISKRLARQAKRFNLCPEGKNEIMALASLEDKSAMIRIFLKNLDFCLANDYPDTEFIRRYFGDIMHEFGIFADEPFDMANMKRCVALGASSGRVEASGFQVSEIFVKHESVLNIVAGDRAMIMVDAFDHAGVHVEASGNAKVCVNRYGNARVTGEKTAEAGVRIIEKQKKTYGHE
jgi:hypothetical protein